MAAFSFLMWAFMSHLPSGALNRTHNALIGATAADIGAHVFDDLLARRLRIVLEQVGRAHDLAGLAIAALRHALGEPGFLYGMARIRRQALDGCHELAGNLRNFGLARECTLAVDVHHARATQAGAAAELGSSELQILSDYPQ